MQDRLTAIFGEDFNDADRIRICARCGHVFWAGRVDMVVCATCAPAWRVAQHRARKVNNKLGASDGDRII
jgi:hypothetical protein